MARLALPEERGGLLVLERKRSEPFTDDDLALARVQARQLVGDVSTRLGPRPIAWSAQLEAVQSVAAQLTRLTSVEEVSAALCSQTQRVVAFDNARVYVLREDGQHPRARWPSGRTLASTRASHAADLRVTVGEGITGWVAATGQQLIVHDAARDPARGPGPRLGGPGRGVDAAGAAALRGPGHRRGRALATGPLALLRR